MTFRKACLVLIASVLCAAHPAPAQDAELDQIFRQAATAFDEGRFDEAAAGFQELLDRDIVSKEVYFNLGNSLYRAGQNGNAVLAYRRAWRLAPRDTDIQANLRFVMNEGNAVMNMENPLGGLLLRVSLPEWWGVASIAWGLLWVAVAGAILVRRLRPALLRASVLLAILSVVAAVGIYRWEFGAASTEVIVTRDDGTEALYAPLDTADAHFALPPGSILRVTDRQNGWLKVSIDDRDGWIRPDTVTTVKAES